MARSNVARRRCGSSRSLRLAHVWIRNIRLVSLRGSRVPLAVPVSLILPELFGDTPRLRPLPLATPGTCRPSALRPSARLLLASVTANLAACMVLLLLLPRLVALVVSLWARDRRTKLHADDPSRLELLHHLDPSLGRRRHRLAVALAVTLPVPLGRLAGRPVVLPGDRSASPTSLAGRPILATPTASSLPV